jgi:hypothetical protein
MVSLKIYCVRIGTKYGPEYEDYINSKLEGHDVYWIREPYHRSVPLQWNKMIAFNKNIDAPVVVMDIDKLLINDFEEVINYPCARHEFVSIPYWWNFNGTPFKMSGGFYKFWPKENKNIYETFMSDIKYWTEYYIKAKLTIGPVNGEFMFVQEHLQTELKLMPDAWFTRWVSGTHPEDNKSRLKIENKYREVTGNSYLWDGEDFHPDIKMVHFTRSDNKPHEWNKYENYL